MLCIISVLLDICLYNLAQPMKGKITAPRGETRGPDFRKTFINSSIIRYAL